MLRDGGAQEFADIFPEKRAKPFKNRFTISIKSAKISSL